MTDATPPIQGQSSPSGITLSSAVDRFRSAIGSFRSSYPPAYPVVSNFSGIGQGYPLRKDFKSEEKWLLAMTQYCAIKAEDIFSKRLQMAKLALDLHSQTTTSAGIPTYARETTSYMPEYEFINPLTRIVNVKLGEFASREYDFNIFVVNEEAKSKKDEYYKQLLLDAVMRSIDPEMAEQMNQGLPNTDLLLSQYEGTLEDFVAATYRDKNEAAAERLFKDWIERSGWREWLIQTYKYYLITETAFAKPYIDEASLEVINPLIHPTQFVVDVDCEDNYFTSANYYIYFDYESLESLSIEHPDLTIEEIKENIGSRTHLFGLPVIREHESNRYDIMVVYCGFKYPEERRIQYELLDEFEIERNAFGELELIEKTKTRRYKERYEELYNVKVIGGTKVVKGGKAPFQLRSVDDPRYVNLGARALIYDYSINPNHPNITVQVAPLIKYLNYLFFKLMEKLSKMKGAQLVLNIRKIPNMTGDMTKDVETLIGNMTKNNVILVDDDEMGSPSRERAVDVANLDGEQELINSYLLAINQLTSELEKTLNFNQARVGGIGKYETSTAAQINKSQSDFGTADKLIAFETFVERVATDIINLLKVATVAKKRRFEEASQGARKRLDALSLRIGDDTLAIDDNFLFTDIGLSVKKRFDKETLNRKLDEVMNLYLQQGGIKDLRALSAVVHLTMLDDPSEKDDFLVKFLGEQEAREQEQAAAQMQAQQDAQAQNQVLQGQINSELASQASQNKISEMLTKQELGG